jgi:ribose transport system permease protein
MAAANSNPARSHRWRPIVERFGPLAALILLIIGTTIVEAARTPPDERAFLTIRNFSNILGQSAFTGIVAIGMTFVIILGGIDLSVGSMTALAAGAAVYALNATASWGASTAILVAIGVSVLGGTLLGTANGLVIAKGRLAPFIVTLGTLAIYRSLILAPAQGSEIRSNVPEFGNFGSADMYDIATWACPGSLWSHLPSIPRLANALHTLQLRVVLFFLAAGIAGWTLRYTTFGRAVFAIGDNPKAARYAGIKIGLTTTVVYSIAGLACGVAAFLAASRLNSVSSSSLGLFYELDAIAAVVIGGTRLQGGAGRVFGTVVGVLILGVVSNMLNMLQVSNFYHGLVKGLIIIAAVLVQPRKNEL